MNFASIVSIFYFIKIQMPKIGMTGKIEATCRKCVTITFYYMMFPV